MIRSAAAIAALIAFAAPVAASESLARSLGLEAGLYSRTQLVQLATLDGESPALSRYILSNPEGPKAAAMVMSTKSEADAPLQVTVSLKLAPTRTR